MFTKKRNNVGVCGLLIFALLSATRSFAQPVPSLYENIPYLVTFGRSADVGRGDDDHSQTVFFMLPQDHPGQFYIRVYDPETGVNCDEMNGKADTQTSFQIFGGDGCYSGKDARGIDPVGGYNSGILLGSKMYGGKVATDEDWVAFGPFTCGQGERVPQWKAAVFKLIVNGISGNDGNLYRLFLSSEKDKNVEVAGGNSFTFEYSMRVQTENSVAHIFPYADTNTTAFQIKCFDFDSIGQVKLFSPLKNGYNVALIKKKEWGSNKQSIGPGERNRCLTLDIVRPPEFPDNMVVFITDQDDKPVPLFGSPIGGISRYRYNIKVTQSTKHK